MYATSGADRRRSGPASDPHVGRLSALMLDRAAELGASMADLLCREVAAYRDSDLVPRDEVYENCVANLVYIFSSLADDNSPDLAAAAHVGAARAVAGVPLTAVMTAYRIGFRLMWEETAEAARAAHIPAESVLNMAARVFFAQDVFTEAMASAYRQQLTTQILEQEQERSALVEALLFGSITEAQSLWDAAHLLRLPTSGSYLVVAAELPVMGKLGLPGIENKLASLDIRSAWRLLPDLHAGIVHIREGIRSPTMPKLLASLRQAATARVGVSPPFDHLTDTVNGLRLARLAITGKSQAGSLVTVLDDAPLTIAAVSAPQIMATIKTSVLGPLNDLPSGERAILFDTFRAWLDANGSANDAATKIYCHANTVRHRLHKIEKLTDRSLARPKDVAELCLALEIEQWLP